MLLILLSVILGLALLGFLITSKTEKKPKGLLKLDSLAGIVSENPKWYLPFSILGVLFAFIFNLIIYAFYSLTVTFHYFVVVLQWIYDNILVVLISVFYKMLLMFVALWKWAFDKLIIPFVNLIYEIILMILDVLLMILRIAKHYFVVIPIELLLHAIRAVIPTLKWSSYRKSLVVVSVGMLLVALTEFAGFILSMPIIGEIGLFLSMVAVVSWVVGLVSFDSHKAGRKAAFFSGGLVALTVLLLSFTFGINLIDDMFHWAFSWTGIWTGFWYSPSMISITLAVIIAVTLVFMTSVGAIYTNEIIDKVSYRKRISGFAREAFKRAWTFILQPVFIGVVGIFILMVPYLLLNFSADNLNKLVDFAVSDKGRKLNVELKKNTISNEIEALLSDASITEEAFVKYLDTLEKEKQIRLEQSENERYAAYFKSEIPKISLGASAVMPPSELAKIIKDLQKAINDKIASDIKKSTELNNSLSEMKMDTSSYYMNEQITAFELSIARSEMLNKSLLKSMNEELDFRKSCQLKYALTLLFFLIGKTFIFGLLITLIVNLFGYSVKPIYDMHSSNFLVDEVKLAQEKNRLQPWIGMLLLALLLTYFLGFNSLDAIKGMKIPNMLNRIDSTEVSKDNSSVSSQEALEQGIAPEGNFNP